MADIPSTDTSVAKLIAGAISKTPPPFQKLASTYLPVFYRMTEVEIGAVYLSLTSGDSAAAQQAIHAKMTDAELLAETEVISGLLQQQAQAHASLTQFGKDFIAASIGWSLAALVSLVGL